MRAPNFLDLNDPAAHSYCHRLRAIAGVQLLHDVFDMNFDGLLRDEEAVGDIAVSISSAVGPAS